eukprot:GEMP01056916.1.p1 GENE.GEMP01056916.1~~GEMP01056916.1.p1  ORF type:complete len:254 (+),score=44.99 GEMP01056916.1:174-935(+)
MFSSFYPQELSDFLATAHSVIDFISVAIVFITKICMCVVFWRFFHWKLSLVSYLVANVVGMQYLMWFFYKWARTSIYFFAYDTFWSSIVLLVFWGGHELNLLDLPQIIRIMVQAVHGMLDLTGDRKFDFEDIKVICSVLYKYTRRCIAGVIRRGRSKITGKNMEISVAEDNGHDESIVNTQTVVPLDPTASFIRSIRTWKALRAQGIGDNETKCGKCGATMGLHGARGEEQGAILNKPRETGIFEKMALHKTH